MTMARLGKWMGRLALVGMCWVGGASPAAAFCATCYSAAAGAGSKVIHALQAGILVLAIPTLAVMVGLVVLAYRRRNPEADTDPVRPEEPVWEAGPVATLLPYNKNWSS